MELIAFLIAISLLGVLAQVWGADTRSLGDWQPQPEDWALPSRRRVPRASTESRVQAGAAPATARNHGIHSPAAACAEA